MSTALDRALADMREGRVVLVVAASNDTIADHVAAVAGQLREGETAWRTYGSQRVAAPGGGSIVFRSYASVVHNGGGRGLSVDHVYIDHGELYEQLAPTLVCSRDIVAITHC
ncbi:MULTISPECIES: hypothetical protein [unclassified Nocardia]|uniref:hypothetical protein n=1 Tax=unclassified Nocardia TaxID=2637762 RepID=UPI00278C13F2|nr:MULTISPECIES: hypothetical protein [unclassified Nocardia]